MYYNVASRNRQQPVTKNEQGVALVSGCTARLFSQVADGSLAALIPYEFMLDVLGVERYEKNSSINLGVRFALTPLSFERNDIMIEIVGKFNTAICNRLSNRWKYKAKCAASYGKNRCIKVRYSTLF